ncbi:GGDEF domain-containing protein [Geomonas agri]|uniref:GGDEF domain-containing protein n=1 Tax=Geomonas agri TaxID=2873702 RepID=UPI001CD1C2D7|nr:GGDEF domain-containing protein [Geomonas agri]
MFALMGRYFRFLEALEAKWIRLIALLSTSAVFLLDICLPDQYLFTFVYLFPVSFVAWFVGARCALGLSLMACILIASHYRTFSAPAMVFDVLSNLGVFLAAVAALARIRVLLDASAALCRTDPLTGAYNRRAFLEMVEYELARQQRGCCVSSLAYLDLDNFKAVNDTMGHAAGDELLKAVVDCIRANLRATDIFARMGGDEFCILLPRCNEDGARNAMAKLRAQVMAVVEENRWAVSLSIGVITIGDPACGAEDIIRKADELMYQVKGKGKDDIVFASL